MNRTLTERQKRYQELKQLYAVRLESYQLAGRTRDVAMALIKLGHLASDCELYSEAIRHYELALEQLSPEHHASECVQVLNAMGLAYLQMRRHVSAEDAFRQAFEIAEVLEDDGLRAQSLHYMGIFHARQGDVHRARKLYQQSLDIDRKRGNDEGVAETLHEMGNLMASQGLYDEAQRYYHESLQIKARAGDRRGVAITQAAMGQVSIIQGDIEDATQLWRQSLRVLQSLNAPEAQLVRDWLSTWPTRRRLGAHAVSSFETLR